MIVPSQKILTPSQKNDKNMTNALTNHGSKLFFYKTPYKNMFEFIYINKKNITNPPKTTQIWSKNINKQSKIHLLNKIYYFVSELHFVPQRP